MNGSKVKEVVANSKDTVIKCLDQDGNGQIDSTDIILLALKVPGVKVDRAKFLQKEFFKNHPQEVIDLAIATTPAQAGIPREEVDKIVDEVIKFERNAVSGISLALGMPGGVAMAATIPADIAQYLKAMAKALASGVEKKLLNKALTKGAIFPFVKSIAKWFSINMAKKVFAGFFKKAIPVVGGAVGCGITYATFKPCCYRLKDALHDTMLSNPDHKSSEEENKIYDDIEAEFGECENENNADN